MTLALRLRKWGGGGGKLLLAFIHPVHGLEAGVTVSAPRQGAEEDRELWPPQGPWEGPQVLPLPPSTLFPPIPFFFTGTALRGKGAATSWLLWPKGRSWRQIGGGSKARLPGPAAARQRCSPCSTRRTHFPRWLGSAAESVGISREGGMRLPPSRGENHSTVKDALHPCPPVIVEELYAALGKSRPLSHLPPAAPPPPIAAGKCLKRQRGVIQVYGLTRDEVVHNVSLPTRLPEVCKILVRRLVG